MLRGITGQNKGAKLCMGLLKSLYGCEVEVCGRLKPGFDTRPGIEKITKCVTDEIE
jgi:hypothetical protein